MKKKKKNTKNTKNHCSCKAVSMKKGRNKKVTFLRVFFKKHSKQIFKYSIKILEVVKVIVDLYIKIRGLK